MFIINDKLTSMKINKGFRRDEEHKQYFTSDNMDGVTLDDEERFVGGEHGFS